jgi:hypothetical protein
MQRGGLALPQLTEENEDEEIAHTVRIPAQENIKFKVTSFTGYVYRSFAL